MARTFILEVKVLIKKCEQCGRAFEAQRSTARFCSPRCRKAFNRGVPPNSRGISLKDIYKLPPIPAQTPTGDIDSAIEATRTAAKAMDACGSLRDPRAPLCRLVAERIAAAFREVGL